MTESVCPVPPGPSAVAQSVAPIAINSIGMQSAVTERIASEDRAVARRYLKKRLREGDMSPSQRRAFERELREVERSAK